MSWGKFLRGFSFVLFDFFFFFAYHLLNTDHQPILQMVTLRLRGSKSLLKTTGQDLVGSRCFLHMSDKFADMNELINGWLVEAKPKHVWV